MKKLDYYTAAFMFFVVICYYLLNISYIPSDFALLTFAVATVVLSPILYLLSYIYIYKKTTDIDIDIDCGRVLPRPLIPTYRIFFCIFLPPIEMLIAAYLLMVIFGNFFAKETFTETSIVKNETCSADIKQGHKMELLLENSDKQKYSVSFSYNLCQKFPPEFLINKTIKLYGRNSKLGQFYDGFEVLP